MKTRSIEQLPPSFIPVNLHHHSLLTIPLLKGETSSFSQMLRLALYSPEKNLSFTRYSSIAGTLGTEMKHFPSSINESNSSRTELNFFKNDIKNYSGIETIYL